MPRRSPLRASLLACAILAIASASSSVTAGPSLAASKAVAAGKAKGKLETSRASAEKAKEPEVVGDPLEKSAFANATSEDDAACFTARKKLFVEGEGWIVRRVTTCR